MSFNNGTFERDYNWVDDDNNGIGIEAVRMDGEFDNVATGLSSCILKDGTQTITADIPFANNKITLLKDATASTDATNLKVIQNRVGLNSTSSGTDTVTLTLSPAITAYVAGQEFTFKAGGTNTGATTININTVGAKDIKNPDGTALTAGIITADKFYKIRYDGTQFILLKNDVDVANLTEKTTLVDDDLFIIEDSEATNEKKKVKKSNIVGAQAFTDLTDTPANYTDKAGYKLKVNAGADAVEFVSDTFLSLSDTPSSYTASKFLAVNGAGDAVELVDTPSSVTLYTDTVTASSSSSVTANAFNDIGLSIASVVVATGQKVKISGFVSMGSSGTTGENNFCRVRRDSTVIGVGEVTGNRTAVTSSVMMSAQGFAAPSSIPFEFVDSPSAGTYTYSVQAGSNQTTMYFNRGYDSGDAVNTKHAISQLTVEVI
jgi:hypothetical protein